MRWVRRGRIIEPPRDHAWWRSRAQVPTPLVVNERHWRIFFSGRDGQNKSHILAANIDPSDGMRCFGYEPCPILAAGDAGHFDSAGQGPSAIVSSDGLVNLYYLGMHLRRDVPYGLAIGLATSDDGGRSFRRRFDGPVLSANINDPLFTSLLFVERDGAAFSGWYMSGRHWIADSGADALDPWYDIKPTSSVDGISWTTQDGCRLGLADGEAGMARPWAFRLDGKRYLSYSSRGATNFREAGGDAYRLMHVELDPEGRPSGERRMMQFTNPPESSDWDGWMQAYACIVPYRGSLAMFYCGNGFGETGIGWAELDEPMREGA